MRDAKKPHDLALRQSILDAAVAELAARGVDAFSMEGVGARAGIDALRIKQMWANTSQLLMAAVGFYTRRHLPVPDTGTLRGDLMEYSKTGAKTFNSPIGRRMLHAIIATPNDWDVQGWRPEFLGVRERQVGTIVRRAVERGECPPGTDPVRVIDLLAGSLLIVPLVYDRVITDADCEYTVETLLTGILGNSGPAKSFHRT